MTPKEKEPYKVTIKDLAAATGYSVGTISRVLNHQPNVSQQARERVLKAAEQYGFQPNANAKLLKQMHTDTILVLVKGISNQLFDSLVETLQRLMAETPYPLIVDYVDEDDNEVQRAIDLCREKKPRGILFLGGEHRNFLEGFQRISQPSVLVTNDASGLPFPNLSSVCCGDRAAARLAIDHLVGLGHRRIAVIGGCRDISEVSQQRYLGCLDAFQNQGVDFDEERDYVGVRFSFADGYRATQELLSRGRDFTAICALSDVMAIGAVRALRDRGLGVPEDVSIMGFDGLAIGEYTVPMLATVAQSVEEMARRSVKLLRGQMESGWEARHEVVPVTLKPRESARAIS